ncbi:heterokaryon incompatibility protein-domain-containing protein [Suillus lakei]|nr:heterokaryon incompatibility protein-domain-containing protein [Suillus lakei]
MLSKLDDDPNARMQKLRQHYPSRSEVLDTTVRPAIHAHLENAPFRLINTSTGRLCDRDAQLNAFTESAEYGELLYSSVMHGPLQMEPIKEAVAKHFSWVMLSHRWEREEPLLHDIQDKDIYNLDPVGTVLKLQKFCKVARDEGHCWAWSDTCCIDQNNDVELQESVNSMFIWYRRSALTIVYLSGHDVPPSDHNIVARASYIASSTVDEMDVRTLEIV